MNGLWLAPVLVMAVGTAVAVVVARDLGRAGRGLTDSVARYAELRAAVGDLQEAAGDLRRGLDQHRRK